MKKLTHEEIAAKRVKTDAIQSVARVPLIVLVDNVRSLYNVGSIFRTSDGAMIQELILTGFTPTPPRKEIEKTALGSTQTVPWSYVKDPLDALARFRNQDIAICCLEQTDESVPYTAIQRKNFPLCLVIGNEITGISKQILEESDFALDIPMHGTKHSLNVGVAYGIAVFALCHAWRNQDGH